MSRIEESFDSGSKVTDEREEQLPKQFLQSCLTDEGMKIDERDEQSKKESSAMHESVQPVSNVTSRQTLAARD
jgi:hypothetical protein